MEAIGPKYRSDIVVVGFCLNDVGTDSINQEYIERLYRYEANALFHFRLTQFVASRVERIRMVNWMKEKNKIGVFEKEYRTRISPIGPGETRLQELMQTVSDEYPSGWYKSKVRIGRLRYAFERVAALQANLEFRVVVVIFPWLTDS